MRNEIKPLNDWAEKRARQLIADEFRRSGCEANARQYETGGYTTAPLRAFAAYIRGNNAINT
jgi:hypothetical protein